MASRKGTGRRAAKKGSAKRSREKSAAGKRSAKTGSAGRTGARKSARGRATTKTAARKRVVARRAPRRAAAPPPLPAAEKRAIVARYIAAYNARDTAAILALYDARATMEDPVGLPAAVGHAAIAELYKMGFDMGVTIEPDGVARLAGPAVAFPLIASSPTSKLHVIDVFEFGHGGKIVGMKAYWGPDNLEGDLAVRQ